VIHPKTLLISRHFYSLESYVWRPIYNLKIDTISTYDIPLDRTFLKLWNGIRHVMPSTDRRLELKEKTSMAQNAWQAFVYANGLMYLFSSISIIILSFKYMYVMPKNGQYDWNMQHMLTRLITIVVVNVICLSGLICNTDMCNQKHPLPSVLLFEWLPMKRKKTSLFECELPHVI